jgi:hypothetical protein
MSHVSRIELEIKDPEALKAACERLGGEVIQKNTYAWYGRSVGDHPLPDGFTKEDLGKCDYALSFPHATYEVGVVQRGKNCTLLWDFYSEGGLARVLGHQGGLLKQAYTTERVLRQAKKMRKRITQTKDETNTIRITMML